MDQNQRDDIRKQIEAAIEKTKVAIANYQDMAQPISPENSIGRVSRMDAINNKSVVEAALRKAQEKLSKLEMAIKKVDDDDFGICARCSNPIPIGRVMLMPESRNCVRCAR